MYLLASLRFLLYSVHLNFVSPASFVMPLDVVSVVRKADVHMDERESQADVLGETDVLYVMRVQKERFADEQERQLKGVSSGHVVLSKEKEDVIVIHPLPRPWLKDFQPFLVSLDWSRSFQLSILPPDTLCTLRESQQ